jgi:HEPN domain-containing protein
VYHQRSFPKTHDLAELLKIALLVDPLLEDIRANVRELLPYVVAFRYPGEEATREESRRAVLAMKNVRELLRERLGLP